MLTRCPACTTTFRVTPEQLKARSGKVRCGKCQTVFNALDSLVEATAVPPGPAEPPPEPVAAPIAPPPAAPLAAQPVPASADSESIAQPMTEVDILLEQPLEREWGNTEPLGTSPTPEEPEIDETAASAEAIRDAGLHAGLVAARETTEAPGYDKWAEGAFTAPISVSLPTQRPTWPFVVAALALLLALGAQLAHHFRAELAVSAPSLRPLLEAACEALDCDIPLPRQSDLVSIEASDLQADPSRGGALMLVATLKNRAPYAQAWPLLEITLTDTQDNALLRRVLQPSEYLPAKFDPTVFPPSGEVGIRLWLAAADITASGYRLYVFYP